MPEAREVDERRLTLTAREKQWPAGAPAGA
jgi:hypothetical protein